MNPDLLSLKPLSLTDFDDVIALGNRVHGEGYLDNDALTKMLKRSVYNDLNCSYVLYDTSVTPNRLIGFRLTYAPNSWPLDKWCTPDEWPVTPDLVAYFKCNTIHPDYQGRGLGGLLLKESVATLKKMGAKAGLSHIWMQSPGNASYKYFTKAGGQLIKLHPRRWHNDVTIPDYICILCGKDCHCDATEMMLEF